MSMISTHLPGAHVLDLFAGTGALGLEALSRGAAQVEFVELAPRHLALIRANADRLGAGDEAVTRKGDALAFIDALGARAYDVAFADPPYRQGLAVGVAERWLAVPFATLLGVEHESREAMPEGGRTRRYGSTAVTLYHAAD